jgi:hypothetical protein
MWAELPADSKKAIKARGVYRVYVRVITLSGYHDPAPAATGERRKESASPLCNGEVRANR